MIDGDDLQGGLCAGGREPEKAAKKRSG